MLFIQSTEWLGVFRQVGTVGAVCLFFGAIIWKVFIPMMRETVNDARKERDRMATQLDQQARDFTTALKYRDDKFREVADAIDRAARR